MAKTTNYELYIEDDATTKIQPWREKMNGTGNDSNMVIIDRVLGEKADSGKQVYGTLLASAWQGNKAPFTQEISVAGLTATQIGDINVSQTASFDQRQAAREAQLVVVGQSAGKLVIAADGEMPDIDIPYVVTLLG